MHYGKASKKVKGKPRPSGGSGSRVNAGNPVKPHGKSRKVPLPNDICWRCGKGRHQKGQPCKAVEAICRKYGTKGHYKKVCMKKSTHLVNVPGTSTTSTGSADYQLDYFNEHGNPVYAHMVHAKEINQKKTLNPVPNQCQLGESQ